MGLDLSAIMLEGDHVQNVPRIFAEFGFRVEDCMTEQAAGCTPPAQDAHEVQVRGNWTVFVNVAHDPESDQPACEKLSKEFDCRLFTMNFGDHGNYYDYGLYDRGERKRWWCYSDDEVDQEGSPLPEEHGTEEMPPDQRVVAVMARLGVSLISGILPEADALDEPVRVFRCRSRDTRPEVVLSATSNASPRPWWKFW